MKSLKFAIGLAIPLLCSSLPTMAGTDNQKPTVNDPCRATPHVSCRKEKTKDVQDVPEINAAGAGLALALLGGICAMVRERRRNGAVK